MEKSEKGFTILEILIAIVLFSAVAILSITSYSGWQTSEMAEAAASDVTQSLILARQRAMAGMNDSAHGVYFITEEVPARFVLYQGSSYAARDRDFDQAFSVDQALSLETDLPGNEINFSRGLAEPSEYGQVEISLKDGSPIKIISISQPGLVEFTE
jgi:type II secretory pathway pseudopilin PulG